MATGAISARHALVFATLLGISGTVVLGTLTNQLTMAIGIFGFVAYVIIYGIAKRRSVHGTVIGSISGAVPPIVGYTAAIGRLDYAALILFLIVVFWQMPHFYAIAMYRLADYKAAGIPVLPLHSGMQAAKRQIVIYVVAFTVAAASLTLFGFASYWYLIAALCLGGMWLWQGMFGLKLSDNAATIRWARKMFGISLLVIPGLCLAISLDSFMR